MPLILLAIFAITLSVIVREVQVQNLDIRSLAGKKRAAQQAANHPQQTAAQRQADATIHQREVASKGGCDGAGCLYKEITNAAKDPKYLASLQNAPKGSAANNTLAVLEMSDLASGKKSLADATNAIEYCKGHGGTGCDQSTGMAEFMKTVNSDLATSYDKIKDLPQTTTIKDIAACGDESADEGYRACARNPPVQLTTVTDPATGIKTQTIVGHTIVGGIPTNELYNLTQSTDKNGIIVTTINGNDMAGTYTYQPKTEASAKGQPETVTVTGTGACGGPDDSEGKRACMRNPPISYTVTTNPDGSRVESIVGFTFKEGAPTQEIYSLTTAIDAKGYIQSTKLINNTRTTVSLGGPAAERSTAKLTPAPTVKPAPTAKPSTAPAPTVTDPVALAIGAAVQDMVKAYTACADAGKTNCESVAQNAVKASTYSVDVKAAALTEFSQSLEPQKIANAKIATARDSMFTKYGDCVKSGGTNCEFTAQQSIDAQNLAPDIKAAALTQFSQALAQQELQIAASPQAQAEQAVQAAKDTYAAAEALFIKGGGTKEQFASNYQNALAYAQKNLSPGVYAAYESQISRGLLLPQDVQKLIQNANSSCRSRSSAGCAAADAILINAYDSKTRATIFTQYPQQQAYKDYLKSTGKSDSAATQQAFYLDSMRAVIDNRDTLIRSGSIRPGINETAVLDQAARGQYNAIAGKKAIESTSLVVRGAIWLFDKIHITQPQDFSSADKINGLTLERQLQNQDPAAYKTILSQYEKDQNFLSAKTAFETKNKGKTYTTADYHLDLLTQGIQMERAASPHGLIGAFIKVDNVDYIGSQAKAFLSDKSSWLEEGILSGKVNPKTLQGQLDSLKADTSLTQAQRSQKAQDIVRNTFTTSFTDENLKSLPLDKGPAFTEYLKSKGLTDTPSARRQFIDHNVDEYMKCQSGGAVCDDFGVGQENGRGYTLSDALSGRTEFGLVNQGVKGLSGFDRTMMWFSGGDYLLARHEADSTVATLQDHSFLKGTGINGFRGLNSGLALAETVTNPFNLRGIAENAILDLFHLPDTYEARGVAWIDNHFMGGGTKAYIKPAAVAAVTFGSLGTLSGALPIVGSTLQIAQTTFNSYLLVNSFGNLNKSCESGSYASKKCLFAVGNSALMAAFTFGGASLNDLETGRALQDTKALSTPGQFANTRLANAAAKLASNYKIAELTGAYKGVQATNQIIGKGASGFFGLQAADTCLGGGGDGVDCVTSLGMFGVTAMSGFGRIAPQFTVAKGLQADLGFTAINAVQIARGCFEGGKSSPEACIDAFGFTILGLHQTPVTAVGRTTTTTIPTGTNDSIPDPLAFSRASDAYKNLFEANGKPKAGVTTEEINARQQELQVAIGVDEAARLTTKKLATKLSGAKLTTVKTPVQLDLKASADVLNSAEKAYTDGVMAGKTGDELAKLKQNYEKAYAEVNGHIAIALDEQVMYPRSPLITRAADAVLDIFRANAAERTAAADAMKAVTDKAREYEVAAAADKPAKRIEYLDALEGARAKQIALEVTRLSGAQKGIYQNLMSENQKYAQTQAELAKAQANTPEDTATIQRLSQELAIHDTARTQYREELAATRTVKGWLADKFGMFGGRSGISLMAAEALGKTVAVEQPKATAQAETGPQRFPRFESDATPVVKADLAGGKAVEITSDGKNVRVIDTTGITDPKMRDYLDGDNGANARLVKVQKALSELKGKEIKFYSDELDTNIALGKKPPQDQLGNIIKGATRGDESQFLTVRGGGGKTETGGIIAAERVHFTGEKQVIIEESKATVNENKAIHEAIFKAEGVKRFYLTERVADLSPKDFSDLLNADVVVTTKEVGYEWMPDYSKGSPNAANQGAFVKGLESGKGFEFIVDEVKTIWDPALRLAIAGDPVVYATTPEGKADVVRLAKAAGYTVGANGVVTEDASSTGPLVRLRTAATEAIQRNGTQGLRELFDAELTPKGEMVLRQDIRVRAYRDMLVELKATHPEAAANIDRLLEQVSDLAVVSHVDKAVFDAFEERVNGLRGQNISDPNMIVVRDEFLEQAAIMETTAGLYADVVGNKYEPVRRIITAADGSEMEVLVVVPKDRNTFEGKQLSDGLQNLIYNTEGKRIVSLIDPNARNLPINVNDVTISLNSQEITILEINKRARSTLGMSLEANEVAPVWGGAAAAPEILGGNATNEALYGGERPIKGVYEVDGVGGIRSRLPTKAELAASGEKGVMAVNAANREASDIEMRSVVSSEYGDLPKTFRNRNNLHIIESIDAITANADGSRTVNVTRQRVEPVEVNGKQKYQMVTETVERLVDAQGRMISRRLPNGLSEISERVTSSVRGAIVNESPITLKSLDALKITWRQEGKLYVDYYEKGADIGVNPASFRDESLRVFGDRSNTSSEWYQALIRARGNEGGTVEVYTAFSPDAELVVIGDRNRQMDLTGDFRTMADANTVLEIQRRGTAIRLQYLNEFMAQKINEIRALVPDSCNCKAEISSILQSGERRLNVRIGATEVDIQVELARQAQIVQETIERAANLPSVRREINGGLFGIGKNQELATLVRDLTYDGSTKIIVGDRLDFSKKTAEQIQGVKPYTQGKNIAEIVRSMEAYTYANTTDPLANVTATVVRGINEPKTALTATVATPPSTPPSTTAKGLAPGATIADRVAGYVDAKAALVAAEARLAMAQAENKTKPIAINTRITDGAITIPVAGNELLLTVEEGTVTRGVTLVNETVKAGDYILKDNSTPYIGRTMKELLDNGSAVRLTDAFTVTPADVRQEVDAALASSQALVLSTTLEVQSQLHSLVPGVNWGAEGAPAVESLVNNLLAAKEAEKDGTTVNFAFTEGVLNDLFERLTKQGLHIVISPKDIIAKLNASAGIAKTTLEPAVDDALTPKVSVIGQLWKAFWEKLDPRGTPWFVGAARVAGARVSVVGTWIQVQALYFPRIIAIVTHSVTGVAADFIQTGLDWKLPDGAAWSRQQTLGYAGFLASFRSGIFTGWLSPRDTNKEELRNTSRSLGTLTRARQDGQDKIDAYERSHRGQPDLLNDFKADGTLSEIGALRGAVKKFDYQIAQLQTQAQEQTKSVATPVSWLLTALSRIPGGINAANAWASDRAIQLDGVGIAWDVLSEGAQQKASQSLTTKEEFLADRIAQWGDAERPGFAGGVDALRAAIVDPDFYLRRELTRQTANLNRESRVIAKTISELEYTQSQRTADLEPVTNRVKRLQVQFDALKAEYARQQAIIDAATAQIAELQAKITKGIDFPSATGPMDVELWLVQLERQQKLLSDAKKQLPTRRYDRLAQRLQDALQQQSDIQHQSDLPFGEIANAQRLLTDKNHEISAIQDQLRALKAEPGTVEVLERFATFVGFSQKYRAEIAGWSQKLLGYYTGGVTDAALRAFYAARQRAYTVSSAAADTSYRGAVWAYERTRTARNLAQANLKRLNDELTKFNDSKNEAKPFEKLQAYWKNENAIMAKENEDYQKQRDQYVADGKIDGIVDTAPEIENERLGLLIGANKARIAQFEGYIKQTELSIDFKIFQVFYVYELESNIEAEDNILDVTQYSLANLITLRRSSFQLARSRRDALAALGTFDAPVGERVLPEAPGRPDILLSMLGVLDKSRADAVTAQRAAKKARDDAYKILDERLPFAAQVALVNSIQAEKFTTPEEISNKVQTALNAINHDTVDDTLYTQWMRAKRADLVREIRPYVPAITIPAPPAPPPETPAATTTTPTSPEAPSTTTVPGAATGTTTTTTTTTSTGPTSGTATSPVAPGTAAPGTAAPAAAVPAAVPAPAEPVSPAAPAAPTVGVFTRLNENQMRDTMKMGRWRTDGLRFIWNATLRDHTGVWLVRLFFPPFIVYDAARIFGSPSGWQMYWGKRPEPIPPGFVVNPNAGGAKFIPIAWSAIKPLEQGVSLYNTQADIDQYEQYLRSAPEWSGSSEDEIQQELARVKSGIDPVESIFEAPLVAAGKILREKNIKTNISGASGKSWPSTSIGFDSRTLSEQNTKILVRKGANLRGSNYYLDIDATNKTPDQISAEYVMLVNLLDSQAPPAAPEETAPLQQLTDSVIQTAQTEQQQLVLLARQYRDTQTRVTTLIAQVSDAEAALQAAEKSKINADVLSKKRQDADKRVSELTQQKGTLQSQLTQSQAKLLSLSDQITQLEKVVATAQPTVTPGEQQARAQQVLTKIISELDQRIDKALRVTAAKIGQTPGMTEGDAVALLVRTVRDTYHSANVQGSVRQSLTNYPEFTGDAEGVNGYARDIAGAIPDSWFIDRHVAPSRRSVTVKTDPVRERNITAVGDVHGDWNQLVRLLSGQVTNENGERVTKPLLDSKGNWKGGPTDQLILTGDLFDRAPDGVNSAQTAERIMKLQQDAGNFPDGTPHVRVLLGNHDVNALYLYWKLVDLVRQQPRSSVQELAEEVRFHGVYPYMETSDLVYLYNNQKLQNWLMSLDAMIVINGVLYMHSDTKSYLDYGSTITSVNNKIHSIVQNREGVGELRKLMGVLTDGRGELVGDTVTTLLNTYGAKFIVHGHSQGEKSRDPRVANIDGGLSEKYATRLGLGDNRGRFYNQHIGGGQTTTVSLASGLPGVSVPTLSTRPLSPTLTQFVQQQAAQGPQADELQTLQKTYDSILDQIQRTQAAIDGIDGDIQQETQTRDGLTNDLSKLSDAEKAVAAAKATIAARKQDLADAQTLLKKASELADAQKTVSDFLDKLRTRGLQIPDFVITQEAFEDLRALGQKFSGLLAETIRQTHFVNRSRILRLNKWFIESTPVSSFIQKLYELGDVRGQASTALEDVLQARLDSRERIELIEALKDLPPGVILSDDLENLSLAELRDLVESIKSAPAPATPAQPAGTTQTPTSTVPTIPAIVDQSPEALTGNAFDTHVTEQLRAIQEWMLTVPNGTYEAVDGDGNISRVLVEGGVVQMNGRISPKELYYERSGDLIPLHPEDFLWISGTNLATNAKVWVKGLRFTKQIPSEQSVFVQQNPPAPPVTIKAGIGVKSEAERAAIRAAILRVKANTERANPDQGMIDAEADILTSKDIFVAIADNKSDNEIIPLISSYLTIRGITSEKLTQFGYGFGQEQVAGDLLQIVREQLSGVDKTSAPTVQPVRALAVLNTQITGEDAKTTSVLNDLRSAIEKRYSPEELKKFELQVVPKLNPEVQQALQQSTVKPDILSQISRVLEAGLVEPLTQQSVKIADGVRGQITALFQPAKQPAATMSKPQTSEDVVVTEAFNAVKGEMTGDLTPWQTYVLPNLGSLLAEGLKYKVQVPAEFDNKALKDNTPLIVNGISYAPIGHGANRNIYRLDDGKILKITKGEQQISQGNAQDVNTFLVAGPEKMVDIYAYGFTQEYPEGRSFIVEEETDVYSSKLVTISGVYQFESERRLWAGSSYPDIMQKNSLEDFGLQSISEFDQLETLTQWATQVMRISDYGANDKVSNIGRRKSDGTFILLDAGNAAPGGILQTLYTIEDDSIFYEEIRTRLSGLGKPTERQIAHATTTIIDAFVDQTKLEWSDIFTRSFNKATVPVLAAFASGNDLRDTVTKLVANPDFIQAASDIRTQMTGNIDVAREQLVIYLRVFGTIAINNPSQVPTALTEVQKAIDALEKGTWGSVAEGQVVIDALLPSLPTLTAANITSKDFTQLITELLNQRPPSAKPPAGPEGPTKPKTPQAPSETAAQPPEIPTFEDLGQGDVAMVLGDVTAQVTGGKEVRDAAKKIVTAAFSRITTEIQSRITSAIGSDAETDSMGPLIEQAVRFVLENDEQVKTNPQALSLVPAHARLASIYMRDALAEWDRQIPDVMRQAVIEEVLYRQKRVSFNLVKQKLREDGWFAESSVFSSVFLQNRALNFLNKDRNSLDDKINQYSSWFTQHLPEITQKLENGELADEESLGTYLTVSIDDPAAVRGLTRYISENQTALIAKQKKDSAEKNWYEVVARIGEQLRRNSSLLNDAAAVRDLDKPGSLKRAKEARSALRQRIRDNLAAGVALVAPRVQLSTKQQETAFTKETSTIVDFLQTTSIFVPYLPDLPQDFFAQTPIQDIEEAAVQFEKLNVDALPEALRIAGQKAVANEAERLRQLAANQKILDQASLLLRRLKKENADPKWNVDDKPLATARRAIIDLLSSIDNPDQVTSQIQAAILQAFFILDTTPRVRILRETVQNWVIKLDGKEIKLPKPGLLRKQGAWVSVTDNLTARFEKVNKTDVQFAFKLSGQKQTYTVNLPNAEAKKTVFSQALVWAGRGVLGVGGLILVPNVLVSGYIFTRSILAPVPRIPVKEPSPIVQTVEDLPAVTDSWIITSTPISATEIPTAIVTPENADAYIVSVVDVWANTQFAKNPTVAFQFKPMFQYAIARRALLAKQEGDHFWERMLSPDGKSVTTDNDKLDVINNPIVSIVVLGQDSLYEDPYAKNKQDLLVQSENDQSITVFINTQTGEIWFESLPRTLLAADGNRISKALTVPMPYGDKVEDPRDPAVALRNARIRFEWLHGRPMDSVNVAGFGGFTRAVHTIFPNGIRITPSADIIDTNDIKEAKKQIRNPKVLFKKGETVTMDEEMLLQYIRGRHGSEDIGGTAEGRETRLLEVIRIVLQELTTRSLNSGGFDPVLEKLQDTVVMLESGSSFVTDTPWVGPSGETDQGILGQMIERDQIAHNRDSVGYALRLATAPQTFLTSAHFLKFLSLDSDINELYIEEIKILRILGEDRAFPGYNGKKLPGEQTYYAADVQEVLNYYKPIRDIVTNEIFKKSSNPRAAKVLPAPLPVTTQIIKGTGVNTWRAKAAIINSDNSAYARERNYLASGIQPGDPKRFDTDLNENFRGPDTSRSLVRELIQYWWKALWEIDSIIRQTSQNWWQRLTDFFNSPQSERGSLNLGLFMPTSRAPDLFGERIWVYTSPTLTGERDSLSAKLIDLGASVVSKQASSLIGPVTMFQGERINEAVLVMDPNDPQMMQQLFAIVNSRANLPNPFPVTVWTSTPITQDLGALINEQGLQFVSGPLDTLLTNQIGVQNSRIPARAGAN